MMFPSLSAMWRRGGTGEESGLSSSSSSITQHIKRQLTSRFCFQRPFHNTTILPIFPVPTHTHTIHTHPSCSSHPIGYFNKFCRCLLLSLPSWRRPFIHHHAHTSPFLSFRMHTHPIYPWITVAHQPPTAVFFHSTNPPTWNLSFHDGRVYNQRRGQL
jgi:hypothetical protein